MDKKYKKKIRRACKTLEIGNTSIYSKQHKKISKWKTPGLYGRHRFWFKKSTSIHEGLALEMNKMPILSARTRMDDQRKEHIDLVATSTQETTTDPQPAY